MKQGLGGGVPFKVVVPSTFFFKVIIKDGVLCKVRLRCAIAQVSDFVHAIQLPEYFWYMLVCLPQNILKKRIS